MFAKGMIYVFEKESLEKGNLLIEFVEEFEKNANGSIIDINTMSQWVIHIDNKILTTDKYNKYAESLIYIIYSFRPVEKIYDFKSTCHWSITSNDEVYILPSEVYENSIRPSLVLCHIGASGYMRYIFGFFVDDGSIAVSDPMAWGLDSFVQ